METLNKEYELIEEMMKLLEKTAFDSFALPTPDSVDDMQFLDAALINLRILNARYDKHDAIVHVHALMEKYNIQLDELFHQPLENQ